MLGSPRIAANASKNTEADHAREESRVVIIVLGGPATLTDGTDLRRRRAVLMKQEQPFSNPKRHPGTQHAKIC
jgi:hypothetical protein